MKKRFTPPVLVLLVVLILFSVVSCKDNPAEAPHEHTWDEGSVTTAPTCTKKGVKTYKCTGCGETKTESVAKLSHSFDESTGKCTMCQGYKAGDNVAAVYDSTEKTLLVTGSGDMTAYTWDSSNKKSNAPWFGNDIIKVIIDDGVTSVSNNAFRGMEKLTDVVIGKDVKSINEYVFYGCVALKNMIFAEGSALEKIGRYSFYNCKALKSISLPEGLVEISFSVFTYTGFEELDIPSTLDFSKSYSFWNPENLTKVNVAAGNTSAKSVDGIVYSIDGKTVIAVPANRTDYTISPEIEAIGRQAFSSWKGTTITIPGSVKTIGSSAFSSSSISSVTFENGVETLGEEAFAYSKVSSIVLPESLKSIGQFAFGTCSSLTSIEIKSSQVNKIDQNAFKSGNQLSSIKINMTETAWKALDTQKNKWGAPTAATFTWSDTIALTGTVTASKQYDKDKTIRVTDLSGLGGIRDEDKDKLELVITMASENPGAALSSYELHYHPNGNTTCTSETGDECPTTRYTTDSITVTASITKKQITLPSVIYTVAGLSDSSGNIKGRTFYVGKNNGTIGSAKFVVSYSDNSSALWENGGVISMPAGTITSSNGNYEVSGGPYTLRVCKETSPTALTLGTKSSATKTSAIGIFSISLNKGETYTVTCSGSASDVIIGGVVSNNGVHPYMTQSISKGNVVNNSYDFTAPEAGTYYIVLASDTVSNKTFAVKISKYNISSL